MEREPPGLPRPGPGGGRDPEGYVCTSSPTPGRWDSWLPSTSSAYMLSNRKGPFSCSTKAACGQRHGGLPGQGPALGTGAKVARPSGRQAGEGQAMGPAQAGVQRQKTEGCPARSGRRRGTTGRNELFWLPPYPHHPTPAARNQPGVLRTGAALRDGSGTESPALVLEGRLGAVG